MVEERISGKARRCWFIRFRHSRAGGNPVR